MRNCVSGSICSSVYGHFMATEAAINHMDILQGADLLNTLSLAIDNHKAGIMTYLNGGKWQVVRVDIESIQNKPTGRYVFSD